MKKILRKLGFKFWTKPCNIQELPPGVYTIRRFGYTGSAKRYETSENFKYDYGSWNIPGTHEGACCTNDIDYIKV
jgi:hypothetical protein